MQRLFGAVTFAVPICISTRVLPTTGTKDHCCPPSESRLCFVLACECLDLLLRLVWFPKAGSRACLVSSVRASVVPFSVSGDDLMPDSSSRSGQKTAMIISTSLDLPEHRQQAIDACPRQSVFPTVKLAIAAATESYKKAWRDGPPYAYHLGLEAAPNICGNSKCRNRSCVPSTHPSSSRCPTWRSIRKMSFM